MENSRIKSERYNTALSFNDFIKEIKESKDIKGDAPMILNCLNEGTLNEKECEEISEVILEKYTIEFIESGKSFEEFNLELTNEGVIGSILGGVGGFTLGKSVGKIIAKVLGVNKGLLYDLLTSRIVGAALGAEFGKRLKI